MVFVMNVREDKHMIYALEYKEVLTVAKKLKWTRTASWKQGNWYATRGTEQKILDLIKNYEISNRDWNYFFK